MVGFYDRKGDRVIEGLAGDDGLHHNSGMSRRPFSAGGIGISRVRIAVEMAGYVPESLLVQSERKGAAVKQGLFILLCSELVQPDLRGARRKLSGLAGHLGRIYIL